MVLQTETYNFDDEVQRLEDDISELESLLSDMDGDHAARGELAEIKNRLSVQLNGVRWAAEDAADADYCPAWDDPVDAVTLAGLTGGEVAKTNDTLPDGTGEGARRVNFVAAGSPHPGDEDVTDRDRILVDSPAPYVDAKPSEQTEDDRVAVVSRLPDPFLRWAHARINELTTVGGNGKLNFEALREEIEAS
ncbi:hypothetical protein U3A55_11920 [Salarchaeum sp. III]|uniref:hypothetical protein n=1 Tax=Salarchaeum sp. III TaxID=3107927 RepID=UPI002EDA07E0